MNKVKLSKAERMRVATAMAHKLLEEGKAAGEQIIEKEMQRLRQTHGDDAAIVIMRAFNARLPKEPLPKIDDNCTFEQLRQYHLSLNVQMRNIFREEEQKYLHSKLN